MASRFSFSCVVSCSETALLALFSRDDTLFCVQIISFNDALSRDLFDYLGNSEVYAGIFAFSFLTGQKVGSLSITAARRVVLTTR